MTECWFWFQPHICFCSVWFVSDTFLLKFTGRSRLLILRRKGDTCNDPFDSHLEMKMNNSRAAMEQSQYTVHSIILPSLLGHLISFTHSHSNTVTAELPCPSHKERVSHPTYGHRRSRGSNCQPQQEPSEVCPFSAGLLSHLFILMDFRKNVRNTWEKTFSLSRRRAAFVSNIFPWVSVWRGIQWELFIIRSMDHIGMRTDWINRGSL